MEQLNHVLFAWINATPASPEWMIDFATFLARDLIIIVPLLIVGLWLWGPQSQLVSQREVVAKTTIALLFAMLAASAIGALLPHERPFVAGVGYTFLAHAPDSSFPSDHGTAIFTFALAFLFWHRVWSGALLMIVAAGIAWSGLGFPALSMPRGASPCSAMSSPTSCRACIASCLPSPFAAAG